MSHKLTPKQLKAIYLLACGGTTIKVGETLRLRRETLSRWKKIPEFQVEFERVMQEMRDDMQHRLTTLVNDAIGAMSKAITTGFYDPEERMKTALSILKLLGIDRIVLPDGSAKETKQ